MKVGICIIVFNLETRVFVLQIEAIKKFCTDDYTIEVVDNSTLKVMREAIEYHAKRLGVKYRNTEPNTNDASWSHAFAANFSYQKLKDEYDLLAFFDHDLIPVKPFSVKDILGDKTIAGVTQGTKVKYLWPGCLFINNNLIDKDMVRFDPLMDPRLDTGGSLYKLIEQYPEGVGWLDEIGCHNPLFSKGFYYFYIMIHQKTFMHFLNSSNWKREKDNDERVSSLIAIANEMICQTL
jgi:hypothetical protein